MDTTSDGLRSKIGDGVTPYSNLVYTDQQSASGIVVQGYYYNNKFYRLNSIVDGKADWRELVDANNTITEISKEDINYITSIEPGSTFTIDTS